MIKSCKPLTCFRREVTSDSCCVRRAYRAVRSCSFRFKSDWRDEVLGLGFGEVGIEVREEVLCGGGGGGGGRGCEGCGDSLYVTLSCVGRLGDWEVNWE